MLMLVGTGGVTPYTWTLAGSQKLPPGLALVGDAISGIPTSVVTNMPVSVVVTDTSGQKAQATISISVQSDQGPYPPPAATKVCTEIAKTQRCFTVSGEVIASIQRFMVENERAGLDASGKPVYKYQDWFAYLTANIHRALEPVLLSFPTPDMAKARAGLAAAEAAVQKARDAVVTAK